MVNLCSDESESFANIECDVVSLSNLSNSESELGVPAGSNKKVEEFLDQLSPQPTPSKLNNSSSSPSLANESQSQAKSPESPNRQKFEKKISDEISKIFQENSGSFYFSPTFDLTNSIERQQEQLEAEKLDPTWTAPQLWRKADDRFFWNKTLLADLVEPISSATSKETAQLVDLFVLPLIQGFIQIESFVNVDQDQNLPYEERLMQKIKMEYRLCLISRRSRFRLGKFY